MKCDMQPTGKKSPAGTPLYQCSREACRQGPWPSPTGKFSATCLSDGLGDRVSAAIKVVTLGQVEECQGCRERREWLNGLAYLNRPDGV